jgi:zinc/manganese transport system ATP-binding protein
MAGSEDRAFGSVPGGYAELAWRSVRRALAAAAHHGRATFVRYFDAGYAPDSGGGAAPAIAVADLTVAYQRGAPAIDKVTVDFPSGSMTAIVGPNGAGKSTLLKAIAGILRPRAGRIDYGGGAPRAIAYLPQSDEVDREFPITVADFVALGRWRSFGAFHPAGTELGVELTRALEAVGLAACAARPIAALSVGQFRRALFARLMLQEPSALLLDEPFAAIDAATTAELLQLVERWHKEGRTIIAVLHDLEQVRRSFPRCVLLARRCIAAGDSASVMVEDNLARAGFGARETRS